jgi:hypothetical protein
MRLLRGTDLLGSADQGLHVVADLVRDHVGLREVAGRAEALRQVIEEGRVEVHPLIERTVERTHGGLAHAAGGFDRPAEQHELRLDVLQAVFR